MLKFTINEKTKSLAEQKIRKLCDDLRIYNPMVSKITLEVFED
jgi:phosphoribosylformylglycinamidine synthase